MEPPSVIAAAADAAAAAKEEAHTDINTVHYKGGGAYKDDEKMRQSAAADLPTAVSIIACAVFDFPSLKYQHVFAIRNTETQENLVYLRCDSQEDEGKWRRNILKQIAADHTAAQQLALSTALNFLTDRKSVV